MTISLQDQLRIVKLLNDAVGRLDILLTRNVDVRVNTDSLVFSVYMHASDFVERMPNMNNITL